MDSMEQRTLDYIRTAAAGSEPREPLHVMDATAFLQMFSGMTDEQEVDGGDDFGHGACEYKDSLEDINSSARESLGLLKKLSNLSLSTGAVEILDELKDCLDRIEFESLIAT